MSNELALFAKVVILLCVTGLAAYITGQSDGRKDKAKTVSPEACSCCGGVAHYTEDGVTAWCRDGQFSG